MIRIDNLSFSFEKNDPVLEHISIKLEDGRIYGLLGENGVGKTTLLTLLCGLKKPCEGSITAESSDGESLFNPFSRHPRFLEEQYFIPDEVTPYPVTASEFAERTGRFWPKFSLELFNAIMAEFENEPGRKMSKMSAGQLKKTYIAFALATRVKHLFMDEPTNGLDIPSKAQFRKAILKYTAEDSIVVISTHQVRDLESVIDPVIILDRKAVLLNATIDEIAGKLYFDYGNVLREDALYREQLPGGFIQVCPRGENDIDESKVNLEALFNAVHGNKELTGRLFAGNGGQDNE